MTGEAGARPVVPEGAIDAPTPATPSSWAIPLHFSYLAAVMLLIELAVILWIIGLIRPLSALGGWW
jgi:hypothetical protein